MRANFASACLAILLFDASGRAELLTNGGFEAGNLIAWMPAVNVQVKNSHLGVAPFEGKSMAVLSPAGSLNALLGQTFDPNGIDPLYLSFAYNLKAVDFLKPETGLDMFTVTLGDKVLLSVPYNVPYGVGPYTLGWRRFSTLLPKDWEDGPVKIGFNLNNTLPGDNGQSTTAYIDAVSIHDGVIEVTHNPEPSSLALAGLGAAGAGWVAWRRRRQTWIA